MSKETTTKYVCDRCGAEIYCPPREARYVNYTKSVKHAQLMAESVEPKQWITENSLPDNDSITINAYYWSRDKLIDLCPKCAKEFRKFMKNKL